MRPDDFGDLYADPKRVIAAVKRGKQTLESVHSRAYAGSALYAVVDI